MTKTDLFDGFCNFLKASKGRVATQEAAGINPAPKGMDEEKFFKRCSAEKNRNLKLL